MTKTLLVTGGTGFIGSHLVERLVRDNYRVILVKRNSSDTWRIKPLLKKVKSYDIDETAIEDIFSNNNIDGVVHLATHYRKDHGEEDIARFSEAIIRLPVLLLEELRKQGRGFFINTGTFFEYEPQEQPIDENGKKKAYNLYAAYKTAFSGILKHYSERYGIRAVELVLFAPYGPKDNEKLHAFLIRNLLQDKRFEMTKGEQRWNWTYVADIVEAYMKGIEYAGKMKSSHEVFNIGSDTTATIREIIQILETIAGKKAAASFTKPYRKDEIFYAQSDNSKAKRLLGWKARHSLQQGLQETYDYYAKEAA